MAAMMPRDLAAPSALPESDDIHAIPIRHYGRWAGAALAAVLLAGVVGSLWKNPGINHLAVTRYLFDPVILSGVGTTLLVTVLAMAVGVVLATGIAIMRLSDNPVLRFLGWLYVWFFRGTPVLVQVVFWGYLGLLYGKLKLGIPFTPIVFATGDTNQIVSAFTAGLIALGLNEAAYASEIVRAGLLSVDHGQTEAAASLGMSPTYALRRIVLPQAMRVIIPPMGNETISMLKTTSLLQIIATKELFTVQSNISSQNLEQVALLIVASFWYLLLTTVLSVPQFYLERRFARGSSRTAPPTPLQQVRAALPGFRRARKDV